MLKVPEQVRAGWHLRLSSQVFSGWKYCVLSSTRCWHSVKELVSHLTDGKTVVHRSWGLPQFCSKSAVLVPRRKLRNFRIDRKFRVMGKVQENIVCMVILFLFDVSIDFQGI